MFNEQIKEKYALALLKDKNMEAAEKYKEAFDKMAKTYPYAYDIESEREIMAVAELRNS